MGPAALEIAAAYGAVRVVDGGVLGGFAFVHDGSASGLHVLKGGVEGPDGWVGGLGDVLIDRDAAVVDTVGVQVLGADGDAEGGVGVVGPGLMCSSRTMA